MRERGIMRPPPGQREREGEGAVVSEVVCHREDALEDKP